jgi:acetoacetyl-[acyl-carrier protein] synthase
MARIPVITGFGGINAAGRSSGHQSYRRTVIDALDQDTAQQTWRSLAALMNRDGEIDDSERQYLADHTLIRRLESQYFEPNDVAWNRRLAITPAEGGTSFSMARRNVPRLLPEGWTIHELDHQTVRVDIAQRCEVFMTDHHKLEVSAAGQVPTGFDPLALYPARNHPRGLQLTVYAASDALGNLGLDWDKITAGLPADQISVYAGSAMSQLDGNSNGGLIASRYLGKRVTSKHVALGLAEMPADFVNAYILGNLGTTGLNMAACATYLSNMRQAVGDIRSGRSRIAVIGAAEAPLVPEIFDGYATMRALATDAGLLELDQHLGLEQPDWRRACRPFSNNCGFTLAEGSQFTILMDDELALELGADILGTVADVYVNADGYKKSISAPGVGNYLTFAKAAAVARSVVGEKSIRERSFIHAHGTGTPANRRTESHIFNQTAKAFGVDNWPVAAIKCYLGHTMAASGGDQLASLLGTWQHGIIPGIATIDSVADDVSASNLRISPEHKQYEPGQLDVAFINAKGFGGNNATAAMLAPHIALRLLENKHGAKAMKQWRHRVESTREQVAAYDAAASAGKAETIYRFDHQVRDAENIHITADSLTVDGYEQPISLDIENPFDIEL